MDKIAIQGGKKLYGTVNTSGAKNSSLILMFACLLAEGTHMLHNVPKLKDVESASALLESLGCKVERDGGTLKITTKRPNGFVADYDLVRKMRASILCLGPLLGRYGEAVVSLPGGCAIGSRPVNLHIDAMTELGADIKLEGGYIHAKSKRLKGANILFEVATVGGTENAMMAAALAEGVTTLENAAKEPEIVDLANFLNAMGAKISGAGTSIITIEGVDELHSAEHTVIPDRIEAGTLLIAGAISGGEVNVAHCVPQHLDALVSKLRECGLEVSVGSDTIQVKSRGLLQAADITTAPHPGFPTDLQAQFMALMCLAEGTSVITESVFENRFMHVQELLRMGADITPKTRVAVVRGNPKGLTGAPVMATDLRASACLVLAGLAASGETTVSRIYHLDRGYERLEEKLQSLGAQIKRIT
jgi:UDP-N-acetylglucosamine 1-carboxyvinyltransferase